MALLKMGIEGQKSEKIVITRGVRQGCPHVSPPHLFNNTIEMLALVIQQSQLFKGLAIQSNEHRILLYVDDAVFVMTSPTQSTNVLKGIVDRYAQVSEYRIN